jgi:hypothetical protein
MSDQEKTEKEMIEEKKTTITIAERPAGDDPDDEKDTITAAEKDGERGKIISRSKFFTGCQRKQ